MDAESILEKVRGTSNNGKPARARRSPRPSAPTVAAETAEPDTPASLALADPPFPDDPAKECFHGLAGEFVDWLDPNTEASRVAILMQVLVAYGNMIGPTPHFRVERTKHHLNLFAVLVGQTSKGRKGTSWQRVREPLGAVDQVWADQRILGGLSSGEGLIHAVRDDRYDDVIEHEKHGEPEVFRKLVDKGVDDKRLLVIEPEFAAVLKQCDRTGNILAATLRQLWESGTVRNMSNNSKYTTTGAHFSLIGHVSAEELRRYLSSTEAAGGTGNRILWVAVRRSKMLPEGGSEGDAAPWIKRFGEQVGFAKAINEMPRDDEARELWHARYPELSRERPGLVGALTARAEAQSMRLACLYALLDGSYQVEAEHLRAALALWDYCERSVAFIFGNSTGNVLADTILSYLRKNPEGVARTDISSLFSHNETKTNVEKALFLLLQSQLVKVEKVGEKGRPKEIWTYVPTKKTK